MARRLLMMLVIAGTLLPARVAGAQEASADHLTLTPAGDTLFTIEGHYPRKPGVCESKQRKPLRARYRGRLDLIRAEDGSIRIIDTLDFERYLYGLAEVPPSWPDAALRAQAIAARSYGLDALKKGGGSGYDICATDQCQVYRGATVELGAFGDKWVRAVNATRARALTYEGRVVQAFYFSTSDGRTRRSFPGGTPQPYYPSVSGEDGDTPLGHWVSRVSLGDVTAILRSRGEWSGRTITSIRQTGDTVRLSDGAASRTLDRTDFRIALNNDAPCVFPGRYPPEDEGRKLPQTVPSASYTIQQTGARVIIRGRGWGHGIGMSQWGAKTLADRGWSAERILGHYYGPARVRAVEDPGAIRVLAAEGLQTIRISANGTFRAHTGTGSVLAPGDRFEVRGGKSLQVLRGRGPSLKPVLTVTPASTRLEADPGALVTIAFTLSGRARVRAVVSLGKTIVQRVKERPLESGENQMAIELTDASGLALAPGEYSVVVRAFDGLDHVRSAPVAVVIAAPPSPAPIPAAAKSSWPWLVLAGGVLLMLASAASVWRARRQPKVNV